MKWYLFLPLMFVGCASAGHPPDTIRADLPRTIVWFKLLEYGLAEWRADVEERFGKDAVILICHDDDVYGQWYFFPHFPRRPSNVQSVCEVLQEFYPGRPI